MRTKPHIRLVTARLLFRDNALIEGTMWCLFSSRTSHTAIAMARDRAKLFALAARRYREFQKRMGPPPYSR